MPVLGVGFKDNTVIKSDLKKNIRHGQFLTSPLQPEERRETLKSDLQIILTKVEKRIKRERQHFFQTKLCALYHYISQLLTCI